MERRLPLTIVWSQKNGLWITCQWFVRHLRVAYPITKKTAKVRSLSSFNTCGKRPFHLTTLNDYFRKSTKSRKHVFPNNNIHYFSCSSNGRLVALHRGNMPLRENHWKSQNSNVALNLIWSDERLRLKHKVFIFLPSRIQALRRLPLRRHDNPLSARFNAYQLLSVQVRRLNQILLRRLFFIDNFHSN